MPTGLRIPVGVSKTGRASVESDESKNTLKLLKLAFSEGNDKNAFQDLGLDDRLIFAVKSPSFRGRALRSVQIILSKYSDFVLLDDSEPIQFTETTEGEIELGFQYIDLLTNKKEQFVGSFTR